MEDEFDKVYELSQETELRFVVEGGSEVTLVLKRGEAEIFGTQLITKKEYVFDSNSTISVFSWQGCTLTLSGQTHSAKIVKETPMIIYVNIHAAIEQMRQIADEKISKGPTILVIGPTDSGKSTMCKFLVNYAVRQGRAPMFVDLDVGQGQITIPGAIGALVVRETIDVEHGFSGKTSLVYHIGHKSPGHNLDLYSSQVQRLAAQVKKRMRESQELSVDGVIINTGGWVRNEGYKTLTQAIVSFEVDVVLVLCKENLYHQIIRDVPRFVKVVYVPRFDAIMERSQSLRIEERENRICSYFYGHRRSLQSYTFQVKFSDLRVYRVITQPYSGLNTDGTIQLTSSLYLAPVESGFHLLNHILTVTFSTDVGRNILHKNVAGFICVMQVDLSSQKLVVLSPEPPPLPKTIYLYSDVTFSRQL